MQRGRASGDRSRAVSGAGKLMSVDDVCDYLGVSRYFVYDQVRLGMLPCIRIARQLRFRPSDVDGFIDDHAVDARVQPLRTTRGLRSATR